MCCAVGDIGTADSSTFITPITRLDRVRRQTAVTLSKILLDDEARSSTPRRVDAKSRHVTGRAAVDQHSWVRNNVVCRCYCWKHRRGPSFKIACSVAIPANIARANDICLED